MKHLLANLPYQVVRGSFTVSKQTIYCIINVQTSKHFTFQVAIQRLCYWSWLPYFIAIPVAYYFMYNWLLEYQYRIHLSWWIFASAGAGAIVVTLFTISYQAIKAAVQNPVKSLRNDWYRSTAYLFIYVPLSSACIAPSLQHFSKRTFLFSTTGWVEEWPSMDKTCIYYFYRKA